ncbi:hypothetical protein L3Y34_012846 [Caenorhabditis briggsae]|uniref:Cyclin-like domain-containing protein n=1 Tax=Caenorhabditis briggsae TaxID=6238 RepID=A0AAE9A029_CAEBR|nr:hypothetical protein L3Y34_012846 [Caenorhabditis briggsae]
MSSTSTESWYSRLERKGEEVDWEKFRVTKEQLETWTRSRHDGISHKDEVNQKGTACDLIYKYVDHFPKTEESHAHYLQITAVASVILHRYFIIRSIRNREMDEVAAGCVMVACRSARVYNVSDIVLDYLGSLKYGSRKVHYQCQLIEMMCAAERDIEDAIGFDCLVTIPHEHLAKMLKVLDEKVKFPEIHCKSFLLATELLLITEWTLTHSPSTIAIVCIRMALTAHKLNRAKFVPEGVMSDWFKLFDTGVTESLLFEMIREVLAHQRVKNDETSRLSKALCLTPTPRTTRKGTMPKTRTSKSSKKKSSDSNGGEECQVPGGIPALMGIRLTPNFIPKGTQKSVESSVQCIRSKSTKYELKIPKDYKRKMGSSRRGKRKDSSTKQNVQGMTGDGSSGTAPEQVDNTASPEANPSNSDTSQNIQNLKVQCARNDSKEGDILGKNNSELRKEHYEHVLVNQKRSSSEDADSHEELKKSRM